MRKHPVGNQLLSTSDATTVPYKQTVTVHGEDAKAAVSTFNHLIQSTTVEVKEPA